MPTLSLYPNKPFSKLSNSGFTLIEMLVVLAIISLMAALAVSSTNDNVNKKDVASLISNLRKLHDDAINSSAIRIFELQNKQFRYEADISNSQSLIFYPDGSSTGGSILDANGDALVNINWRNGGIKDVS